MSSSTRYDAGIVGAGHNGLLAATMLARAGLRVAVLERSGQAGGAAVSGRPFAGVDARLSRYSYLVSLFPAALRADLGLPIELRPRPVASYTPDGAAGLLVDSASGSLPPEVDPADRAGWQRLQAMLATVGRQLFPTLTEPLRSRDELRALIGDADIWRSLFEQPLGELLERTFRSDLIRGLVLTDATIGTFAAADDPQLRQNRCFVYHVIGNGTGRWDVPIGGMGAVTGALYAAALAAGADVRLGAEVTSIEVDGAEAEVSCADGSAISCRHVLANVAPVVLARLLGQPGSDEQPEGSQLKVNLLLARLPKLQDPTVSPHDAFAGTFHVNERYEQLQAAYLRASAGEIPEPVPCELYCHSLTDPSILSPELREAGAHTLTVFALHMPRRLFDRPGAKEEAVAATLRSIDSALGEPIEDCLWHGPDGSPCLEALTPLELELELGMPGGHIFHRDLSWPFAEAPDEVGRWGVETELANVWICGAGARRGGGVSGIPGHNAARAVLEAERLLSRSRSTREPLLRDR